MKLVSIAAFAAFAAFPAAAEEGMWTFDNPPRAAVAEKYGVTLDSAWLDRVREATVRLETGCTGSFISADGLILTNHHCAEDCIAQRSSEGNDLNTDGFLAGTREQELKCEEDAVSVLVGTEDVTAKVTAALKGVAPEGVVAARRAELTKLEQACEEASAKTKDGRSSARACSSTRAASTGSTSTAATRTSASCSRPSATSRPSAATRIISSSRAGASTCRSCAPTKTASRQRRRRTCASTGPARRTGDPVFVSGHPGDTERLLTVSQLATAARTSLPFWLLRFSELRGRMLQYSKYRRGAAPHGQGLSRPDREQHQGPPPAVVRPARRPALMERRPQKEKALRAVAVKADRGPQPIRRQLLG